MFFGGLDDLGGVCIGDAFSTAFWKFWEVDIFGEIDGQDLAPVKPFEKPSNGANVAVKGIGGNLLFFEMFAISEKVHFKDIDERAGFTEEAGEKIEPEGIPFFRVWGFASKRDSLKGLDRVHH